MDATLSFGERNFGGIDLGDARRTRRLVFSADEMCRHPGGTLPEKFNEPKGLRGFYRLVNRPEVTHSVVLAGHTRETRRRTTALGSGVVLILHDATELDYTTKKTLSRQLKQIGRGSHRGYICHNSLAVRADTGETLGLMSQILHQRATVPKGETNKESRERQDRESRLWVQGVQNCGPAPCGVQCVDVADSLSDTFEFLYHEVTQGRHFVVRARENRKLVEPIGGHHYLFDAMRSLPSMGTRQLEVQASPGRAARTIQVQVSWSPVRIAPPGKKLGEYERVPLDLWAVRVWEVDTPAGEEPLEWILTSNCPTMTFADACDRIDWYKKRWIVEELHKGVKTGCGIEKLEFDKIERLEPAIAVISAVATTLLSLRDAARAPDADTRPATEVVDPQYVEVLAAHYKSRVGPNPSVKTFYMHVARLGGHQNRKCDGFPGWITLWRGWMRLQAMVDGFRAARLKTKASCGTN